ncbi:hypothetical protein K9M47_02285 [Candidatus Gracilibacteria bacterium]|nr:hypothetical protein [Candidatus Gracilibacteria bacterium]MCF7898495.1 hypothetical protein [Candidatus Paceibacterota bacterium]
MRLSAGLSHIVVLIFCFIFSLITYNTFSGEGSFQLLFFEIDKNLFAKSLAVIAFGFYGRMCYISPILPNEQGIQLFIGSQNGEVWNESNFLFIPWPIWSIWKRVSIQHFSFTVAAQNRTKEGHLMMVFATGKAIPENVQLLAKISQEGAQEQVLGLSMMSIGRYINANKRDSLLSFQNLDISGFVQEVFGENQFYGLKVKVFTTKVIEVNSETMRQFDVLAREGSMQTTLLHLKKNFPESSDIELYAMYASLIGINPAVMSYIVHGSGTNNILLGRGDGNQL